MERGEEGKLWMDKVESVLKWHGFEKNENEFTLTQVRQQPGQQIVINGRAMQQPGRDICVKFIIRDNGEGYMCNKDDSDMRYFTQLKYEVWVEDECVKEFEHCLFYDEDVNNIVKLFDR